MKKPKQKSYFRFAQIDVFGAIALCFVGTDLKQHERQFASFMSKFKGKRRPEYYWALFKDFKESAPKLHPSVDGATFYPDSDPDVPIVYLPKYEPRILVHEIVHAVSKIMYVYGLEDGKHSEIRAYLTDFLFGRFSEGVKPWQAAPINLSAPPRAARAAHTSTRRANAPSPVAAASTARCTSQRAHSRSSAISSRGKRR